MEYYVIVQWSFVLLTAICLILIFSGLNSALKKLQHPGRVKILSMTIGGIFVWIAALSILSISGFLSDFSTVPPRMFIVLGIPLLALIILIRYGKVSKILKEVPSKWLIYIQAFRFFVEILLWMLFLDNLLPVQMTLEGWNFAKQRLNKKLAIAWNFMGLALLTNIVTIAILSFPTPFRAFMNEPANTIVAQFPIVLLPGILVPIAYWMHVFSLKQLFEKGS